MTSLHHRSADNVHYYPNNEDAQPAAELSDYGSDIALEDLEDYIVLTGAVCAEEAILPSIEFVEGELEELDVDASVQNGPCSVLRLAKSSQVMSSSKRVAAEEVEYDQRSRRQWRIAKRGSPTPLIQPTQIVPAAMDDAAASPLERFRTKPNKPLSVTDMVSPAWCELQYLYTLTKFGRKPQTQAMRAGSKIHKKLENEVHATVPVQVDSKEDRFALRIWNTISGLRCLRETGLTRELEVWGMIDGQVVNGIIDHISYDSPDPVLEAQARHSKLMADQASKSFNPDQPRITEMFGMVSEFNGGDYLALLPRDTDRNIYIADVKTRGVPSVPTGASLRPTWMQLMLYRKLLESLFLNIVDAEAIFERYSLRPLEPLTDVFMQEIANIGTSDEAHQFPTLLALWSLLITETQMTVPPTNISSILRAEFRYAETGDIIGSELVIYDEDLIDEYITRCMAFWKGNREAQGVDIEEAFKCGICTFAADCTWRQTKIQEATEKNRLRRKTTRKSDI